MSILFIGACHEERSRGFSADAVSFQFIFEFGAFRMKQISPQAGALRHIVNPNYHIPIYALESECEFHCCVGRRVPPRLLEVLNLRLRGIRHRTRKRL